MSHPLSGIRVLDFTRVLAGPYITMVLADLGAEVIKIENPNGGDDTRQYRPPEAGGESFYFLSVNRHKKSVGVDITTEEGRALLKDLASKSDILVQNFRPDVMERHGLHYDALKQINPRLIYASISGYGDDSPYRMVSGYDQIAQGEGGIMWMTGHTDTPPVRAAGSIADTFTGLHTGMAIMAALHARERTGEGQYIDLALLDSVIAVTSFQAQAALLTGENMGRPGNGSQLVVPTGMFQCSDGEINILIGNDRQFRRFAIDVLERPELAEDARFTTIADRRDNQPVLLEIITSVLKTKPRDYWIETCRASGVPGGSVRSPVEAVAAPEPRARGLIQTVEHPTAGTFETVGSPIKMSGTPVRQAGPAPLLCEHTDEVLADVLGYDAAKIAALRESGTVA
ncbi:MAG: CaiB/BaiF CoA transferase family protein [Alphaproteobacteria bacterium]